MMSKKRSLAIGLALAASSAFAGAASFDVFTPMVGDTVAGSLPESAPFVLSSPKFSQINIATRDIAQARRFDSGTWDMLTVNENGPAAGRYLFSVHETSRPGIQRTGLRACLCLPFDR